MRTGPLPAIALGLALFAAKTALALPQYAPPPPPPPGMEHGPDDPALRHAFRDGIADGHRDRELGYPFNPRRALRYQRAPGFDPRFGYDQHAYHERYREAFVRGYEIGYREGDRYDAPYPR